MTSCTKTCVPPTRGRLQLLLLAGILVVAGCAELPLRSQEPRPVIRAYPTPPPAPPRTPGSLWSDDAPLGLLFVDQKARTVGDLLTISIIEVASASKQATTQTSRASSINASIEAFLGFEKALQESNPRLNPSKAIAGSLANNFNGNGTTARSGRVTATITAVVTEVLPNGNLVIEGSREITVNHERELIVLSGVVRPKDISPGNTVLSTALGQAKVAYYGSGIIAEKQRPGWLARILDVVWPF